MDVKEYFQSDENYFWEWTTDEDIHDDTGYNENNLISIPNVGTIAYRPYIIEVLKELQSQGFPPFGAILLTLYATQDGYLNLDGVFYYLKKIQSESREELRLDIDLGLKFLENLRNLGMIYKKGQNRIILLQTIFKHSPKSVSSVSSELMLKVFAKRPYSISECATKKELTEPVKIKDIRTLAILNGKFPTA